MTKEYVSAYTVGQLIEKLKEFEPEARIIVQENCSRDFGVDIRNNPDLFFTVELGNGDDWELEDNDNNDETEEES